MAYPGVVLSSPGWTRTTDRLLVRKLPSPLGHRTEGSFQFSAVRFRKLKTENSISAEAVGLEPTSGSWPPPVFKTGSSSGRMTSVRFRIGNFGLRIRYGLDQFRNPQSAFRNQEAAAAGIEPASGRLTAAYPYQHGLHRKETVRTAGFEPTVSCARSTRIARLSHVLKQERPAGVEPALPPWQGGRLPLHHGRSKRKQIVKDRIEPFVDWGFDDLVRDKSPNQPISKQIISGTGGHRTHIVRFKRPVHFLVCHSPASIGAEGVEPTACVL